jgi:hypothetical protein
VATKKLKSIKGRVIRLTRLDECGAPDLVSDAAVIVTDGFVQVVISNEVETGEEYTQKNAWGDFCIAEKDGDRVKWANVSIQFCEVDPDTLDMVGGASPVTSAGDTIGATFGREPNPNAFAIEVWTKKAGNDSCAGGTVEWGYFVVPFVRNGILDGDITINNGALTLSLKGEGQGAPASWGTGPHLDNPMKGSFPVDDLYGIVITDVQPPAVTAGATKILQKAAAAPGDIFPAEATITAEDVTNAGELTALGYIADPLTAWTSGQAITIGAFQFSWDGTAWDPGPAA